MRVTMVDQTVRNVTLPAELARQFHSSPEKDEILLIDETLIDQWKPSPDKQKISPVKVLPQQDRKCNISISSEASPMPSCQPLSKQGLSSLSKAIEAIPKVVYTVPLKRPSVEYADSQKKRPQPLKFELISTSMTETPPRSMKDGKSFQNGRAWRYSTAFSQSNNQPGSIEGMTGPLRRRTINSLMPTSVVTSTSGSIPTASVTVAKENPSQDLPCERSAAESQCEQCGKLSSVCECAAKVVTCGVVSSTCEPLQILENVKRKNRSANQNSCKRLISKQSFYGNTLCDQFEALVSPDHACVQKIFLRTAVVPTTMPVIKKKPRLTAIPEPECLTISSDDEEEKASQSDSLDLSDLPEAHNPTQEMATRCERMRDKDGNIIKSRAKRGPPTVIVLQKDSVCSKLEKEENDNPQDEHHDKLDEIRLVINCRSIRVGSYKLHAFEDDSLPAVFTLKGISFTIPTVLDKKEMVSLTIRYQDIASVLAHFGKALVVLFIYTTPGCGGGIRARLRMTNRTANYYDPCATDETCKRITILPIGITREEREWYRKIFPKDMIQEISQVQANEILVRSVPIGPNPEVHVVDPKITRSQTAAKVQQIILSPASAAPKPIVKLLTYPPPPQTGGITVTSEDLECLNPSEFLNDVIIDFFLKYLVMEKLDESERERMHVFSSFFYPRLTQKPTARNATEENPSLTSQQKKHSRVKTWTRHIDIFQKDFIIVPVNQNAHWFLAIICFPGKVYEKKDDSKDNKLPEETSMDIITSPTIEAVENSRTLTCSQGEEPMDVDPAKSAATVEQRRVEQNLYPDDPESPFPPKRISLVPYDSEDSSDDPASNMTEAPATGTSDQDSPCILIFDSLPGPSRWRIVATLREYLEVEWATKKGSKRSFDRETMKGRNVRVPVQSNFSDCGVYLLQYVESFFENSSKPFTCPNLELWFPEELITQKRDEIKHLVFTLQKRYNGSNSNNGSDESSSSSSSSSPSELNCSNSNAKEEAS